MKRSKKTLITITALLMCVSFTLTAIPFGNTAVSAAKADDSTVQSLENEIENVERKLEELESKKVSTSQELTNEIQEKQYIDTKLSLVGESIDLAENLIASYEAQIQSKLAEIEDMESYIAGRYEQFEEWIKAFYEYGEMSYIEMIFDNGDFNDMLSTAEYISALIEYQNLVMAGLEEKFAALKQQKEGLEVLQTEQTLTSATLAEQKSNYESLAQKSASYIQSLRSDQAYYEAEYQKALEEEEKLNKELEEELARIALQNAIYIGGTYIWPVDTSYTRIISPYGWRSFNGGEFHLGIDIPVPYGANIYAANGGKVIKAEKHYSYGNYVLIDHGGGQATLYAHNSKLLVSVGDTVSQGDVIALGGSTGYSTGNHCHFEVRINGVTTDPLGYVSVPVN